MLQGEELQALRHLLEQAEQASTIQQEEIVTLQGQLLALSAAEARQRENLIISHNDHLRQRDAISQQLQRRLADTTVSTSSPSPAQFAST